MDKSLPTPKEMMLDAIEFCTRWMLIIGTSLVVLTKLSAFLDTFVGRAP